MKDAIDALAAKLHAGDTRELDIACLDVDQLGNEFGLPIVDVRAPAEFRRGHIPGASNIPVFDDAERAEIGTLYKQAGRTIAIERGLAIARSKAQCLVDRAGQTVLGSEFIVHCWRGGMRSEGFAWLCQEAGMHPRRLAGGYKAFRRAAQECFHQPRKLIVLAGHTGSGKTWLLQSLRAAGQQVIDLEQLAGHRGSAFGGLGKPPQPTVEQFENELFVQWRDADPQQSVWIEGESRTIGRLPIPQPVWMQMGRAPIVIVEVAFDSRVKFLMAQYGNLPTHELASAIEKLKKRLGGLRLNLALQALERNDLAEFTKLALTYYDKSYAKAIKMLRPDKVTRLSILTPGDPAAVARLIELETELRNQSEEFGFDSELEC